MSTILITGGTVVSSSGRSAADVLVDGETIAAVLAPGQADSLGVTADRTIDATGKYVVPGGRRRAHAHGAAVRRHVGSRTRSRPARPRQRGVG